VTDTKQFKLPDIGEGLTEADILEWRVAVGDTVEVNQILVEVETAKAAVELPSPWAGVVAELHCANGDTVEVGKPIISIAVSTGAKAEPSEPESTTVVGVPPARQQVLVGYGPPAEGSARRRRRAGAVEAVGTESAAIAHRVLAKPPVRKLAKSLGVDLGALAPTGPNGTVSRDDVTAAATGGPSSGGPGNGTPSGGPAPRHGQRETRIPIKGVRKHTAAAMVASAFTAPHVTEFVTADITATMELRDRVAARRDFRDVKVSPLLFVAKAVLLAAAKTPEVNATWDEAAGEIVLKHYVNLGIAAATERGLVVPNIKDADQLSLHELAVAMGELTETARSGRTSPADMSGGTFTITNVGVFGVDTGTPILNPGEAGILAFGAVRRMPWVVSDADGTEAIEPRWVTQLALSFDHRLVDGQQGSRFLADVAGVLTDPGMALL
jgi:2-oxoisovalerate dehydrogenase E2 component (dihydrolipoyl transacylase)